MTTPARHGFLANAAMIIASLAVCLALAELGIRIFAPQPVGPSQFSFDPERGDIPVPGQQGRRTLPGVYDYTYSNNSLGLRGREIDIAALTPDRVLLLGDSFTYGIGVNDDQTLVARIEASLRAKDPDLEVVNAGNPGTGTDYALKFYRLIGTKLHPRLVALFFFGNDFQDNEFAKYYRVSDKGEITASPLSGGVGAKKQVLSANPVYNWLISWSHAANLLKQTAISLMLRGTLGSGPGPDLITYRDDSGYSTPVNVEITGILLAALRDAVRADGGQLIVFYVPSRDNVVLLRDKGLASRDETNLTGIAKNLGLPLVSMTPAFAADPQAATRLYYAEGHWTAAGQALAAQTAVTALADRLFPAAATPGNP